MYSANSSGDSQFWYDSIKFKGSEARLDHSLHNIQARDSKEQELSDSPCISEANLVDSISGSSSNEKGFAETLLVKLESLSADQAMPSGMKNRGDMENQDEKSTKSFEFPSNTQLGQIFKDYRDDSTSSEPVDDDVNDNVLNEQCSEYFTRTTNKPFLKNDREKSDIYGHKHSRLFLRLRERDTVRMFILRGIVLFVTGYFLGLFFHRISIEDNLPLPQISVLSAERWQIPSLLLGFSAILVGSVVSTQGTYDTDKSTTPKIMDRLARRLRTQGMKTPATPRSKKASLWEYFRFMSVSVGLIYALSRLSWQSDTQISIVFIMVAFGLWYVLDHTNIGFLVSLFFASIATIFLNVLQFVDHKQNMRLINTLWLLTSFFASAVIFGCIGRMI